MRQPCCSITPAVVHREARAALASALDWQPYHRSVSVADLLRLFLLMATYHASLAAVVRRFFTVCPQTAYRAAYANLPGRDRLTDGLVGALYGTLALPAAARRRRWLVAIDTHLVPYYGRRTPDLVGGPKKQGTTWFHGYATAVLLHKNRRYTVGLLALRPRWRPHEVVEALLGQIERHGVKVRGVAMDAAFGGGPTIHLLQQRGLAYAVPLQRVGAGSKRDRLFEGRHKQVRWAEWTTERGGRTVRTRTVLWRGERKTMLFAFGGWAGGAAGGVYRQAERSRQLYKKRFGIETSYRQKNQGQASTASRDGDYRLLVEGVAYLLRQVWVALTEEIARRGGEVGSLPLATMADWLRDELRRGGEAPRSIPLPEPG